MIAVDVFFLCLICSCLWMFPQFCLYVLFCIPLTRADPRRMCRGRQTCMRCPGIQSSCLRTLSLRDANRPSVRNVIPLSE